MEDKHKEYVYYPKTRRTPDIDEVIGKYLLDRRIDNYKTLETLLLEIDTKEKLYKGSFFPAITVPLVNEYREENIITLSEDLVKKWNEPSHGILCTVKKDSKFYKKAKELLRKKDADLEWIILFSELQGEGIPELGIKGKPTITDILEKEIVVKYRSADHNESLIGMGEPLKREGVSYDELVIVINPKARRHITQWEKIVTSPDFEKIDSIRKYLKGSIWPITAQLSEEIDQPVLNVAFIPEYHVGAKWLEVIDYYGLYDKIGQEMEIALTLNSVKVGRKTFVFEDKRPYIPLRVKIGSGIKHPRSYSQRPCEEIYLPPRMEKLSLNVEERDLWEVAYKETMKGGTTAEIDRRLAKIESIDSVSLNPDLLAKFPGYYGVFNKEDNEDFLRMIKSKGGTVVVYKFPRVGIMY